MINLSQKFLLLDDHIITELMQISYNSNLFLYFICISLSISELKNKKIK